MFVSAALLVLHCADQLLFTQFHFCSQGASPFGAISSKVLPVPGVDLEGLLILFANFSDVQQQVAIEDILGDVAIFYTAYVA